MNRIDIDAFANYLIELCKDRTEWPLQIDLEKDMWLNGYQFSEILERLRAVNLKLTTKIDSWTFKYLEVNRAEP